MGKDEGWKVFFSDDERYADLINGILCNGEQVVKKEDLQEMDTQNGFLKSTKLIRKLSAFRKSKVKIRDSIRKVAKGCNFLIIGIESQETIDYSMSLRCACHDMGEYEKQAAKIRKETRKNPQGLSPGEYLYGFKKGSKLYPTITFVLYSGTKPWDGPVTLHEMLDFTDIPKEMHEMVADYRINLVEIHKLKDTSMFQTDVRQVFDFIRCSNDTAALKELVKTDDYYKNMEEDAFDVAVQYTNAKELIEVKDYYGKDGVVDMCQALTELIAEGREEGRVEGRVEGLEQGKNEGLEEGILLTKTVFHLHAKKKTNEEIAKECNITVSQVKKILE